MGDQSVFLPLSPDISRSYYVIRDTMPKYKLHGKPLLKEQCFP